MGSRMIDEYLNLPVHDTPNWATIYRLELDIYGHTFTHVGAPSPVDALMRPPTGLETFAAYQARRRAVEAALNYSLGGSPDARQ